jgi:hypothetical protein
MIQAGLPKGHDFLLLGEPCIGLGRKLLQEPIHVLALQAAATSGKEQGAGAVFRGLVQVAVQGIAGILGEEHFPGADSPFAFHVLEVLATVLGTIKGQKFGNAQARFQ